MNPVIYQQSDLFPLLEKLPDTPGKFTIACYAINLLRPSTFSFEQNYGFSNINHLDLTVNGPFTLHYALKTPTLSLKVNGLLTLGKNNEEMGILAATHGPLTVIADAIDGRYAKLYGKGPTLIESTIGDITVGDSIWGIDEDIKQQYNLYASFGSPARLRKNIQSAERFEKEEHRNQTPMMSRFSAVKQSNGSYAASDNILTLRSARNIFLNHGTVTNTIGSKIIAHNKIQNLAGKISSQGIISIEADEYDHIREKAITKHCYGVSSQYAGSGPAILESLKEIKFLIKTKIYNFASSIRSGGKICNNKSLLHSSPHYIEEPQNIIVKTYAGQLDHQLPPFILSCITQAGENITMNLGDFAITGNMNAGTVAITGNTGSFINTERRRNTTIATEPMLVNVTEYIQQEAQKPGIYRLAADGSVRTEFPLGIPTRIDGNSRVLLGNNQAIPLDWQNISNPLSGINFDSFLQQLISTLAGKILKTQEKSISAMLQENALQWKQHNQKEIISPEDVQHVDTSMLLTQIVSTPSDELQQHTMLCLAPNDINPYQSPGDIATDEFSCITDNDQTHLNNRIVATGPNGITMQSTAGALNLQTQSYTVVSESFNSKTIMQCAMPQQQLIAPAGPVKVHSDKNITRTGTVIAAAHDVTEQSEHGSVIKNPLVLQTFTETRHEKNGLFSSSSRVETSLTHSALPCETHAGTILHDKAHVAIQATAQQDIAQQEIIYEAPQINIEGLLLANTFTSSEEKSGMFTDESKKSSKQTPFAAAAHMQSPRIRFLGESAQVNANIHATELHDETEKGIQFVAKVAEMLCSAQTLISSPLSSADIGFEAGYETMIPPMLMVEKIIRAQHDGHMLFESAIMDKNRTEIIGTFVETTYHLKQWQRNWHHVSPVFPDEALVVIALAITWYTQGMGMELLQPLLTNVTAATGMQLSAAGIAAVNAGISAVYSSATTSFLKTGDPINTAKQMVSPAHVQSLCFTMASAGLCTQLGSMLDINMEPGIKSLSQHVQQHALQSTVDTLLTTAITNAPLDKSLGKTIQQIPLKAIAAYASNEICAAYTHELIKQVGQALVGGLSGFAQEQSRKGFVSGVTGVVTAETIGALLIADSQAIADNAIARLNKKGIQKTPANIQRAIDHEVHERMKLAKIAAASVAALTRQNPTIAASAATNAIDNDIAVRGQLAALSEYQSLLAATSQAYATLHIHQEKTNPVHKKNTKHITKPARKNSPRKTDTNNAAHDLVLTSIEKSLNQNVYADLILEYAHSNNKQVQSKRSLHNRIVHPKIPRLIEQVTPIIRIAFVDALNKTIDTFAMIPNPLSIACFATGTTRDLYTGVTTPGEVIYNMALACGILKGIQIAGKGVKIVYQKGKGTIKNITDKVIDRVHQYRYALQGRVPFVPNPRAGKWTNAEVAIAEDDLVLTNSVHYEFARARWHKSQAAPFNVLGHGNPHTIWVDVQAIHPKGLSQSNLLQLIATGTVELNATQLARLIRTAPGYQKGQHINLFSCQCAAELNGIAQQLARRMRVPVSAFSENVGLQSNGLGFYTRNPDSGNVGIMKTFYPEKIWNYRLIALSLMPAFILSGDKVQHQQEEVPAEAFHRWTHDSLELGLD